MAAWRRHRWLIGLLLGLPLLLVAVGYGALRVSQPQMFAAPEFDERPPDLPEGLSGVLLVYSKTSGGFRHGWSIDAANRMLSEFADLQGWSVFFTENAAVFNDSQLARFDAVVWNNATGAALTSDTSDVTTSAAITRLAVICCNFDLLISSSS